MSGNNALVLASSILNPDHESAYKHSNYVGEVTYMKRFDTEIVDIHLFQQGIIRMTPAVARELVKELKGMGIGVDE